MSIQIVEKSGEGLSRVFGVTVSAKELSQRAERRIAEISPQLSLKGFRPGKVPVNHLRRLFGRSAMAEIVQNMLGEVARKTLTDRGERANSARRQQIAGGGDAIAGRDVGVASTLHLRSVEQRLPELLAQVLPLGLILRRRRSPLPLLGLEVRLPRMVQEQALAVCVAVLPELPAVRVHRVARDGSARRFARLGR